MKIEEEEPPTAERARQKAEAKGKRRHSSDLLLPPLTAIAPSARVNSVCKTKSRIRRWI